MNRPRRRLTRDRASPDILTARFYTTEQLGPKQSLTPEGFLLCEDVPLGRSGELLYGPKETPIEGVNGSPVVIHRTPEELFNPKTVASFNGKSVVNDHPDEDVSPKTWKSLTIGVTLNPREGEGDNAGLLVGDLLITDAEAIADVRAGKREVSLGYDADYEQISPGVGDQTNIIGNHVALVERGRCGPRCAIGDQQTVSGKDDDMPTTVKGLPAQRRRLKARDTITKFKDAAEQMLEDLEDGEGSTADEGAGSEAQHIHIHLNGEGSTAPAGATGQGQDDFDPDDMGEGEQQHTEDDPVEARFQSLEQGHAQILQALGTLSEAVNGLQGGGNAAQGAQQDEMDPATAEQVAEEAPPGTTKDAAMKFRDSAPLEESYKETLALAEILVPGFRMSTYDKAASPKSTLDAMCGSRRKALDAAYSTTDGKLLIESINGGKPFDHANMSCAAVRALFVSAAGAKKLLNNGRSRDSNQQQERKSTAVPRTPEELNAFNREFYKTRNPGASA